MMFGSKESLLYEMLKQVQHDKFNPRMLNRTYSLKYYKDDIV